MTDPYYDLCEDWELIAASFRSVYGIRLPQELRDMKWREFAALLAGLGSDTPLGRAAAVRAEEDPARLREFTPAMRRMRAQWRTRRARQRPVQDVNAFLDDMRKAFLSIGRKEEGHGQK